MAVRIQRDVVLQQALEILDEEGVDGLTMRALATKLKIQAPSLYWHFANKQELLEALADALMEGVGRKTDFDADWQTVLKSIAREIRQALLAHHDAARVFAGTYPVRENVVRIGEAVMATLRRAGGTPTFAAWAMLSLSYYITGFVVEEQALQPPRGGPKIDMNARRKAILALPAERNPNVTAAVPAIFNENFDARFEFGVDVLVRGLEARMRADAGRGVRVAKGRRPRAASGRR
jgi:TetR/AcrR family transcriptional regulator, tetracycline repressor protein